MSILKQTPFLRMIALASILATLTLFVSCGEDNPAAPPGNRAPGVPVIDTDAGAPADAATDVPLAMALHWTCTDPDGDTLVFTVNFGTDPAPGVISTDQADFNYTPAGLTNSTTYYWQITARDDPEGATTASPVWSFTTAAATGPETVSTPLAPSGPAGGDVAETLTLFALGAVSSHGHALQYRFDWGDLTMSNWSADSSIQKSWATAAAYEVKTQARCALHNDIASEWSPAWTVTILDLETISRPDAPTGPSSGETNVSLTFSTIGATSSRDHTVEYRFGWDFNAMSSWSTSLEASHDWFNVGTYNVTVQARCQVHPEVESGWSVATPVEIVEPGEVITAPLHASGPGAGAVGVDQTFAINLPGSSNLGHAVEHQFDWADGEMSAWTPALEGTHAWALAGTYDVKLRARCIEHPTAISGWGAGEAIEITDATEALTTPNVSVFSSVAAFRYASFYVQNATSSFGDPLEYRMDWDTDGISVWQDAERFTHTFEASGPVNIQGQARCKLHPGVLSEWSAVRPVTVLEGNTYMGPVSPTSGFVLDDITFTTEASLNSEGHPVEYKFLWDTYGAPSTWETSLTRNHIYDSAGNKQVTVEARCTLHNTVVSSSILQSVTITWRPTTETITTPGKPAGPATGAPNTPISFSTAESSSSEGHPVEYRFRAVRSGSLKVVTDWSLSPVQDLTFTTLGGHAIYADARCSIHPEAFSSPSISAWISISIP